jgi:hypothetical protein
MKRLAVAITLAALIGCGTALTIVFRQNDPSSSPIVVHRPVPVANPTGCSFDHPTTLIVCRNHWQSPSFPDALANY